MKSPELKKYNSLLLALILTFVGLFYAKDILILLVFAMLLAMLLNPVAEKFEKHGLNRVGSTILCLLVIILAFGALITIASIEVNNLSEQWPQMKQKSEQFLQNSQRFIQDRFGISLGEQNKFIREQAKNLEEPAKKLGKGFLLGSAGFIALFVMVLVFMFLFLLQKEKYKHFLISVYKGNEKGELNEVLSKISLVAQKYLLGMIYSICIVTILYSIGFLVVGLKSAILLAFIASVFLIANQVSIRF